MSRHIIVSPHHTTPHTPIPGSNPDRRVFLFHGVSLVVFRTPMTLVMVRAARHSGGSGYAMACVLLAMSAVVSVLTVAAAKVATHAVLRPLRALWHESKALMSAAHYGRLATRVIPLLCIVIAVSLPWPAVWRGVEPAALHVSQRRYFSSVSSEETMPVIAGALFNANEGHEGRQVRPGHNRTIEKTNRHREEQTHATARAHSSRMAMKRTNTTEQILRSKVGRKRGTTGKGTTSANATGKTRKQLPAEARTREQKAAQKKRKQPKRKKRESAETGTQHGAKAQHTLDIVVVASLCIAALVNWFAPGLLGMMTSRLMFSIGQGRRRFDWHH